VTVRSAPPPPQIKICGLRRPEDAALCAELAVAAVGCVFFDASPRGVGEGRAREIAAAAGPRCRTVGVFVDAGFRRIMAKVRRCGLGAVQLHGRETPELTAALAAEGITVIKALFASREPVIGASCRYRPSAFLVESGRGTLPGGNADSWDWRAAAALPGNPPWILAGGLDPENVVSAVAAAGPDAVDVSSGVESSPGVKDPERIRRFVAAVRSVKPNHHPRRVFP
jgi:phosphoribosylanthranilate isomerase